MKETYGKAKNVHPLDPVDVADPCFPRSWARMNLAAVSRCFAHCRSEPWHLKISACPVGALCRFEGCPNEVDDP